ncbi:hypothetical protein BKA81DRAFT_360815 [Phyllosticta paracitricarpa]|uniref:Uncharacterized protein n=1 Tax=Phyllosticta citricarpa TaxID=55181 RepID=A0ABR1LY90_9PEZI
MSISRALKLKLLLWFPSAVHRNPAVSLLFASHARAVMPFGATIKDRISLLLLSPASTKPKAFRSHLETLAPSVLLPIRPTTIKPHPLQRRMLPIRQPAPKPGRQNLRRTSKPQPFRNAWIIPKIERRLNEIADAEAEQHSGTHGEHGVLCDAQVETMVPLVAPGIGGGEGDGGAELDGVSQGRVSCARGGRRPWCT